MKARFLFSIMLWLFYNSAIAQTSTSCIPHTTTPTVNVWDWRQPLYEWYFPNNTAGVSVFNYLENPFWATPNWPNENIIDLANTLNKDYDPADGWELLQKQMGSAGTANYGKLNPFVLLYNKYTGTIRVFINITNSYSGKTALVRLRFQDGSPQSGLLSSNTTIAQPLSTYSLNSEIMVPNDYSNAGNNNGNYWLFADFQAAYDPCSCTTPATIHIAAYLVDEFTITANIRNTPVTDNVVSGGNTNNSLNFKSAITLANGAGAAYKRNYESGAKFIQGVQAFEQSGAGKKILGNEGLADREKLKSTVGKVSSALSAVPYIGAYIGAASFVFSFFKSGSQEMTPAIGMPNTDLTLSGTISSTRKYGDIFLNLPGGDHTTQSTVFNPTYDNTLGVFTLLENPSVEYKDYIPSPAYRGLPTFSYPPKTHESRLIFPNVREYKVNSLPYVINPSSGLKIFDMQARLLITINSMPLNKVLVGKGYDYRDHDTTSKSLIGPFETYPFVSGSYKHRLNQQGIEIENWPDKKSIKGITYSTGYKPMSCFYDSRFKMFYYPENGNPDIKCEILVILVPDNGDTSKKVFIKMTYNVDLKASTLTGTQNYITSQVIDNNTCFRCGPNYSWKIDAINQYWPNAYPSTTCSGERLITPADITTFCASSKYKRTNASYPGYKSGDLIFEEKEPLYLKLYPNPYVDGTEYAEFNQNIAGQVRVRLLDLAGATSTDVFTGYIDTGIQVIPLPLETLAAGMYVCVLETPEGIIKEKIIIVK